MKWTYDKKQELTRLFPDHSNAEIAELLGTTEGSVSGMACKLKLKKPMEFRIERQKKGYFPKGHVPMNKGRKQTEYMSPEQIERAKTTYFQKGHTPANHRPVGSTRVTVDGYVEIKTEEPRKWRMLHRIVWEQHNGKIPTGHNIQFRDGNRQNCDIDNLYVISREQQLKDENSLHARYPEEVKRAIQLKGALNRQINKKLKEQNYE